MRRSIKHSLKRGRPPHRRGGYLYVAVMAVATIIAVVGLSAMTVARTKLKTVQDEHDRHLARLNALSAVETAISAINDNNSWRSTYTNNVEAPSTPYSFNGGTMTFKLVDGDSSLSDDNSDSATLYGIGRVGDAVQVYIVTISPSGSDMVMDQATWSSADAP